jgi:quercetin dioxygenase-like cupin family protein
VRLIDLGRAVTATALAVPCIVGGQNAAAAGHASDTTAIACVDSSSTTLTGSRPCVIFARHPVSVSGGVVVWTLETFPSRDAAERGVSGSEVVVVADGRAWVFTVGERRAHHPGATAIAALGPMPLPPAAGYEAVLAYLDVPPGSHSRTHTHSGPEAWYVLQGSQCVETPGSALRLAGGQGGFVPFDTPMYLAVTGTRMRHAFFLVVHDSARPWNTPIDSWRATGACTH